MKQFIQLSSIILLALFSASPINMLHAGTHAAAPSVHDMFKDVPQDQLLQMMEEGQQFIKYLEEHGTPEEKMAFQQAMEETLMSFSEEDWEEFDAIVRAVEDKLPPLEIVQPEPVKVEPVKEESVKKEEVKIEIDNSLEKVLQSIHKAINALLLKAKSDKVLAERITIGWENKDKFNDMARLLQVLNKKDHLTKLTTSKDEAIVSLLESIQNFNKRLQLENDQFIIADTFGLETDEKTTAANLKKLNKIIEFFDTAIESLLPKLLKFIEAYEPEALQQAKEHDDEAKKALEHATKVEKQKRPNGQMGYQDRSPSNGSRRHSQQYPHGGQGYNPNPGMQGSHNSQEPEYLEAVHRENLRNIPSRKNNAENGDASKKQDEKKKEEPKDVQYQAAIDALESYLEINNTTEVNNYMKAIGKAEGMYNSFDTQISEADTNKFSKLQEKKSISADLQPDEVKFLQTYEKRWQKAQDDFAKNTQAAHTFYGSLADSIANIAPQVDEMADVIQTIKSVLNNMSSKDLEMLQNSKALKNFSERITKYHTAFKNVQNELKNKHKINRIHRLTPNHYSAEERDYDELVAKVDNMHGLDRKIVDVKSRLDSLQKSIKSTMATKKRSENKQAKSK